jgi:hypothetical protein
MAAPCTQTDGSTANSAACMCGTAFCWDKLFCTASSSLCAAAPPCSNTDGTAANAAECFCGSNKCTSEKLFCFKSSTSGVCGAVAHATSFIKVETGTCQAVSSRGNIMDKTLCTDALENLRPVTADSNPLKPKLEESYQVISSKLQSPGCIFGLGANCAPNCDQVGRINTDPTSTISCSSDTPCICASAPVCTNTNGNTQNIGTCLCGTSVCGGPSSLCTAATNTCVAPTCQNIGGIKPNDAACLCGATICTPKANPFDVAQTNLNDKKLNDKGLYCLVLSNEGRCSPAATGVKNALAEIKLLKDASGSTSGAKSSDKVTALETKVAKLQADLAAIVAQYSLIDDVCKKTTGGRRVADTGIGCGGDASSDSTTSPATSPAPASEDAFLNAANRLSVGYLFIVLAIVAIFTGI